MSKPPPKKAGTTTPSQQKTVGCKTYQTRLTAATSQANKKADAQSKDTGQRGEKCAGPGSDVAEKLNTDDPGEPPNTPLSTVANALARIVQEEQLEPSAVRRLEEIIGFAREAEAEEWRMDNAPGAPIKVSTIRHVIHQDLEHMYDGLVKQILGAQETARAAVMSSTDKVIKEMGESTAIAKD